MNTVFIGVVAAAAVGMAVVWGREQQRVSSTRVRIRDIRRVFQRLSGSGTDGAFAMFSFAASVPSKAKPDQLCVQFSIENARPGLDWELEDPLNFAAKDRVMAFFAERGSPLTQKTMNDVDYLRTEQGDLVALCRDLLTEVFGVGNQQEMDLTVDGFALDES